MNTSNGRRCSYSVPSFSTMSLMVTYIAWSETGVLILYVEPISTSGRWISSVMRITFALWGLVSLTGASAGLSSGFCTLYLTIFLLILMAMALAPGAALTARRSAQNLP